MAGPLADRLAQFPDWHAPPDGRVAQGELVYPDWFAGTWQATSTLEEVHSPLAPAVVTPGLESNLRSLHQPVTFTVRFMPATETQLTPKQGLLGLRRPANGIVADRRFNSRSLAEASLGPGSVQSVTVDPTEINRVITQFEDGSQMVSEGRERAIESNVAVHQFISSEVFQQTYRRASQIYLNQVENTTDYHWDAVNHQIEANQITAIYLSPQDPDYFKARTEPVALYRYQLTLHKTESEL